MQIDQKNRIRHCILFGAVALAVAITTAARAHSEGHGAIIAGIGPDGGRLCAVISAKEAELGPKAKTQAIAEWKLKNNQLELKFWDLNKKKSLALAAGQEVKWILLGKELSKPEIIKITTSTSSDTITQKFTSLEKVQNIEVILPGLSYMPEKLVLSLTLEK